MFTTLDFIFDNVFDRGEIVYTYTAHFFFFKQLLEQWFDQFFHQFLLSLV